MKFEVPLMMPAIHSMRFADSPSRSALMIGTPPATAASNAALHALLLRSGENLVAVRGEQRLVRGDHMLAVGDRLEHEVSCHGGATDQLDHDLDLVAAPRRKRRRRSWLCLLRWIWLSEHPYLLRPRCGLRFRRGAGFRRRCDSAVPGAAAHRTDAEQAYVNGFHFSSTGIRDAASHPATRARARCT